MNKKAMKGVDIKVVQTHYASGRTRLRAYYPNDEPVSWVQFPGLPTGTSYEDVQPGPFHGLRLRVAIWKLRRLGKRFWLDNKVLSIDPDT